MSSVDVALESIIKKIHSKDRFLSLEINPSLSAKIEESTINELRELYSIDAFVVTDSPLARFKPSSLFSSLKFQNALQKPVICTLSMRDRNSLALCGDILGVNELGLRAFLTLTGDCFKNSDCKSAKSVFEGNSLKLASIIDNLNLGIALNGKELKEKVKKIYNFSVINSYANNKDTLISKIDKKISAHSIDALFTQPVYCRRSAEFLLKTLDRANDKHSTNTALVLGFFPVLSYKTAIFLRDKLPGVYIPNLWIKKLESASSQGREEEKKVGLELSLNLFERLQKVHNKFHLMSKNPSVFKAFV